MLSEKFFLKSKTVIAAIVIFLANVGPLVGLAFSQEDAQELVSLYDNLVATVGALLAIVFRVTASSNLRVNLGSSSTLRSPLPVTLIALGLSFIFLEGCSAAGERGTVNQEFFKAKSQYSIVKQEIAKYVSLPFCDAKVPFNCADPELVIKLDELDDKAQEAFELAQVAVDLKTDDAALRTVDAVAALRGIMLVLAEST